MSHTLESTHKYQLWLANLRKHGLTVHGVEEVYTKFKGDGDLLFGLTLLDASTPEGDKMPPICFLKGEVISVLIVLKEAESGEEFALLVRQRRICNGDMIYETVAGMVDGTDDPHAVAVRETEEETGLKITPEQLIPLNEEPLYVSTGTSDEAMYFYFCELTLSRAEIQSYDQQHTGLDSEYERIITAVVPLMDSMKLIRNVNCLLNIYMYLEQRNR
jgi:8-oxo-dGTP pyrophosphatase MutT (NUDIX family)